MNKKPVSYLQTDPRWKSKPYRVKGESSTIGGSGCGPTAASMLIETITGKKFTPEDACNWSMAHGYKALNQGTYYAYFTPQFKEFGIDCQMLNWTKTYGKPDHSNHDKVVEKLKDGYYAIALMGKGLWTSSGHFVVLWWQDGKVRINDPASTRDTRVNGDIRTFRSQATYYWLIDARKFNNNGTVPPPSGGYEQETYTVKPGDTLSGLGKKFGVDWRHIASINGISAPYTIFTGQVLKISEKEENNMENIEELRGELTSCANTGDNPSEWAKDCTEYCKRKGIFAGDGNGNFGWHQPMTREAVACIVARTLEAAGIADNLPDVR